MTEKESASPCLVEVDKLLGGGEKPARGKGDWGRGVDWNLEISPAGMTFLAADG